MERMSTELIQKGFLFDEHVARYNHFSSFISGRVLDCACGIGYASKLLLSNNNVESYIGVDVSQDAIDTAKLHFSTKNKKIEFKLGSILDLSEPDNSVDTFISMETLEHLDNPNLALSEIKRVLKKDGFFIGSVPISEYDEKCESVYGENPYHIVRFKFEDLNRLLKSEFTNVYIGKMTRELVSFFTPLTKNVNKNSEFEIINDTYSDSHGSFLFICTNKEYEFSFDHKFYLSQSLVEYDEEQLIPFVDSMKYAEKLALDRANIIEEMEASYSKRVRDLQDKIEDIEGEISSSNKNMLSKLKKLFVNGKNK